MKVVGIVSPACFFSAQRGVIPHVFRFQRLPFVRMKNRWVQLGAMTWSAFCWIYSDPTEQTGLGSSELCRRLERRG